MTESELIELVKHIQNIKAEGQTIEVKAAHKGCPQKLYDTLSSFSNQNDGGIIVFGLDESNGFKETGVYDAQALQTAVANQCEQMTPKVRALFTNAVYNGKVIVSAEIPAIDASERPCFYSGSGRMKGSYVRVGEADLKMSEYEVYSYEAFRKKYQDDIRIVEHITMEAVDEGKLYGYIRTQSSENPHLAALDEEKIPNLLNMVSNGQPTLACVLLFGLYPQAFFPQYTINATVVPGTQIGDISSDGTRFTDNKRIEGTLPQIIDEALSFCRKNMRMPTIIDESTGERRDVPEYPIIAMREAVLNALVHRDYSIHTQGIPIEMTFYSDRWEIRNPGGLYGRLQMSDLGHAQPDTRNPVLARAMEAMKLAENRYSGIPTIRRTMLEAGLEAPVFTNIKGTFTVTFLNKRSSEAKTPIHLPSEYNDSENMLKIPEFCSEPRSCSEIAVFLGLKTLYHVRKYYIEPLIADGTLKMTIPDKPRSRNQKFVTVSKQD